MESLREFGLRLLAAYIDLRKVFDMAYHKSLWETLRLWEILAWIIGLIASIYASSISAVKRGRGLSKILC